MAFKQYCLVNEQGSVLEVLTVQANQHLYEAELIEISGELYRVKEIIWDRIDRNIAVVEKELIKIVK